MLAVETNNFFPSILASQNPNSPQEKLLKILTPSWRNYWMKKRTVVIRWRSTLSSEELFSFHLRWTTFQAEPLSVNADRWVILRLCFFNLRLNLKDVQKTRRHLLQQDRESKKISHIKSTTEWLIPERSKQMNYYYYYCHYFFRKIYLFQVLSCFPWREFCGQRCGNSHIQEVKINVIIII